MATDIITITGHNLTLKEIIELPSQIDSWDNLKKVWFDDYKNKSDFYFPQQQANIWDRLKSYLKFSQNSDEYLECKEYLHKKSQEKSYWDRNIDEKELLEFWKHNEDLPEEYQQYLNMYLHTYFGWLEINRHSIRIVLMPEHKYVNLFYHNHCKYILEFNREIAKMLRQKEIIYMADNNHGFWEIEQKSLEGQTFNNIMKFGQTKFGIDTTSLRDKIKNMFFIDHISDPIDNFESINWQECEK